MSPSASALVAASQSPQAELLVADVGSTVTKLSAFAGLQSTPHFLGQGSALTTVAEGDVGIGLTRARNDLQTRLGVATTGAALMAASSAAGGLRMSVHGLTAQMTLRAAREASLGAGAIVVLATAGRLTADDLDALQDSRPSLILLAGGVDYGDRRSVTHNARCLAEHLRPSAGTVPVLYAGNRAAAAEVGRILTAAGVPVYCVDNVYPRFDTLNLQPVRMLIQRLFSERIVIAPGMDRLRATAQGVILPTPGAVLRATELLADVLGNVLSIDVGGATTDVHSVMAPDAGARPDARPAGWPMRAPLAPEPLAKRTVEGDLGVYLNASRVAAAVPSADIDLHCLAALPDTPTSLATTLELTRHACRLAVQRHIGRVYLGYDGARAVELIEGRDLSTIQYVIGTGGAFARLPQAQSLLQELMLNWNAGTPCDSITDTRSRRLLPPANARLLIDRHYLMAAAGVMSARYRTAALAVLLDSLGLGSRAQSHV